MSFGNLITQSSHHELMRLFPSILFTIFFSAEKLSHTNNLSYLAKKLLDHRDFKGIGDERI